jgi:endonuclease/exonuclease/phosphatase family metal-dependent hydrolase
MDFDGGEYGTAILSRYPILSFEVTRLAGGDGCEPRSIGHAVIEVNGQRIDYYNTHLTFESDSVRDAQYAQIKTMLSAGQYFILSGDFNCAAVSELRTLGDVELVNGGSYVTEVGGGPIDNVILNKCWRVVDRGMESSRGHSDHHILWAQIKYSDGL